MVIVSDVVESESEAIRRRDVPAGEPVRERVDSEEDREVKRDGEDWAVSYPSKTDDVGV